MLKVTLDTNCVINLLDFSSETATSVDELSEIINYGLSSDVNIAVTTRVEKDFETDKDAGRKEEMLRKVKMFPVIGTAGRWGASKWDSGDFYAGKKHEEIAEELKRILFPGLEERDLHYQNKINDIDHILGHTVNQRDIFVTDDRAILKKAETLEASVGIKVMSPQACLEYLDSRGSQEPLAKEMLDKLVEYKSFIIKVALDEEVDDAQTLYESYRAWFVRKFPKLRDSLLKFRLNLISVPLGRQRIFNQLDAMGQQDFAYSFQNLYRESSLRKQVNFMLGVDDADYYRYFPSAEKRKETIEELFKEHVDVLLGYIGYLE